MVFLHGATVPVKPSVRLFVDLALRKNPDQKQLPVLAVADDLFVELFGKWTNLQKFQLSHFTLPRFSSCSNSIWWVK